METAATLTPGAALKQYFGYDRFRPLQEEIVNTLLAGRDALALMPTGSGKSMCFQIPALVMEGVTVVVSPLIALMKDQVEGLRTNGVAAAYLNSSQSSSEQQRTEQDALSGRVRLLYISPERLLSQSGLSMLTNMKISLFAIDEAHCISSWGHDFRPEYTQLNRLREAFPRTPILALTATADKLTRQDILTQLRLREPQVFISSFDRPNLSLSVLPGRNRLETIVRFLRARPSTSGIIYCLSRNGAESLAESLNKRGFNAGFYHAGMEPNARARAQQDFITDKTPIVCATIAFGMGIDKSNVRWVLHYNLPKSIEGYYQEIGRAGRDGLPGDTVLFYSFGDVVQLREFALESGQPEIQLAKLERMQQYAEAVICRRKVLLNYFGESLEQDCGNCDVCRQPPAYVDGTVPAQMALSAIARMQERATASLVIDVLRGSTRQEVIEKGFHQIKTHGAGRNISYGHWQQYMIQMLNMGLVEVAYDQGQSLHITPQGREVLFNGRKVAFYLQEAQQLKKELAQKEKARSPREALKDALLLRLKSLRSRLAEARGVAPYLVFTDATLDAMAEKRPTTPMAMQEIPGMGEAKFRQFGEACIEAVLDFIVQQHEAGISVPNSTAALSYAFFRRGMKIDAIAEKRGFTPGTIVSHLTAMHAGGHTIDFRAFVSEATFRDVSADIRANGFSSLRELFDRLGGRYAFDDLRLSLLALGIHTA